MSLINDALKRAKQVHATQPCAPPNLQLRPAEPARVSSKGFGLVLPATVITIVVVGLISYFGFRQAGGPVSMPQITSAKAIHNTARAPAIKDHASVAEPAFRQSQQPTEHAAEIATTANSSDRAHPQTRENPAATVSAVAASTVPVPPAPAPPKLQAIVFTPGHPSAIISGKSVCIGDHVKDFRVAAIDQTSATLVSATETNVLKIE